MPNAVLRGCSSSLQASLIDTGWPPRPANAGRRPKVMLLLNGIEGYPQAKTVPTAQSFPRWPPPDAIRHRPFCALIITALLQAAWAALRGSVQQQVLRRRVSNAASPALSERLVGRLFISLKRRSSQNSRRAPGAGRRIFALPAFG